MQLLRWVMTGFKQDQEESRELTCVCGCLYRGIHAMTVVQRSHLLCKYQCVCVMCVCVCVCDSVCVCVVRGGGSWVVH